MTKNSAFAIAICPKTGCLLMGKSKHKEAWEFFGGCAKGNETPRKTAQREFLEETGITILRDGRLFATVIKERQRTIRIFVVPIYKKGTRVKLSAEHTEFKWLPPHKLPAITPTAAKILKHFFIEMSKPLTQIQKEEQEQRGPRPNILYPTSAVQFTN